MLSLSNPIAPTPQARSAAESNLQELAQGVDGAALQQAVFNEILKQAAQFSDGVRAYQAYPRTHRPPEPPVLAQIGAARLLDYGSVGDAPNGPPVLIVPSLINRAYILDLTHERSLVRYMAQQGLRPLLVDWGFPGPHENEFDLSSYITGPLQQFMEAAANASASKPALVGYCMGGLLAIALAQRNSNQISSLSLLATPWDFHSGFGGNLFYLQSLRPGLEQVMSHLGNLPVDILQAMFAHLAPSSNTEKFRYFSTLKTSDQRAQNFVALEDWLNDGVPLVAQVARECLFDWYLDNAPVAGTWKVEGRPITPQTLTCPSLTVIPERDHIVPPGSAQALADILPQNETRSINAGHIGMVTGSHAKSTLYAPLTNWIQSHGM